MKGLSVVLVCLVSVWVVAGCSHPGGVTRGDVPMVSGVMHTVAKGETVESIAEAYQISPQVLMRQNNLTQGKPLAPGTRLFIPGAKEPRSALTSPIVRETRDGLYHRVEPGQTLTGIANAYEKYDVSIQEIQRVNNISDPSKIYAGQQLWIPRAQQVEDVNYNKVTIVASEPLKDLPPDPRVEVKVASAPTPKTAREGVRKATDEEIKPVAVTQSTQVASGAPSVPAEPKPQAAHTAQTPQTVSKTPAMPSPAQAEKPPVEFPREVTEYNSLKFQWPIKDKFTIVRGFNKSPGSPDFNPGVDLGAEIGTEVCAAADGEVQRVGGVADELGSSLGNYIILYHGEKGGGGLRTIYAHNSQNLVQVDQKVKRGQPIAKVGNTGRPAASSSGGVLHFEIREVTTPLDPMKVLPPLR
ncbi:MAG TPA: LysM peptidoglycan-binding domain-containing M23 family metallopeptidase [bacterium]|nr:LysM peptidoglycan-binding domain-containing M23 family metallopeptidase [bacterium]